MSRRSTIRAQGSDAWKEGTRVQWAMPPTSTEVVCERCGKKFGKDKALKVHAAWCRKQR